MQTHAVQMRRTLVRRGIGYEVGVEIMERLEHIIADTKASKVLSNGNA